MVFIAINIRLIYKSIIYDLFTNKISCAIILKKQEYVCSFPSALILSPLLSHSNALYVTSKLILLTKLLIAQGRKKQEHNFAQHVMKETRVIHEVKQS